MFKINTSYALLAIILMTTIYLYINYYHKARKGMASLFANSLFQINRNLQIYLQKKKNKKTFTEWRPSAICISKESFKRKKAFQLLNWISYKYGFGTYLHRIEGYYSKSTHLQAQEELSKLLDNVDEKENHIYIDTIVSPSYTSAIAQSIQIPGISGMENNMVLFEYDKEYPKDLFEIVDNFSLVNAGDFDVCILAGSNKPINFKKGIHVWIKSIDTENANLLILMSFIILGHPDWKKGNIKIFDICKPEELDKTQKRMEELVISGRLPITTKNIEIIIEQPNVSAKSLINSKSAEAGLTLIGFSEESINHNWEEIFSAYDNIGTILFINSHNQKIIE